MTIITNINPDTKRAVRAFIAKVAADFDLANATLFGDSGENTP